MTETIKNLTLAKNRLQAVVDSGFYPEIERDFTMRTFGCYMDLHINRINQCKTFGCILGNFALVLPILKCHFDFQKEFDYFLFGEY